MSAKLTWVGLREYRAALLTLPEDSSVEAAKVMDGEINGAYVEISQVYGQHRHTGALQRRLQIQPLVSRGLTVGRKLRSGSPIAWLFDNGSQARHWANGKSTGRMWGHTPPTHIFRRSEGRARARILTQLVEMMRRRGASTVTGEPDA